MFTSYRWALLLGFYYYIIFQLIYLWRFGSLNFKVGLLNIFLPIIGILSVVFLVFFAKKLSSRKNLLFIPFILALPLSVIGTLLGGLFGPIGLVVLGLVPFAFALPLGYWLIKRSLCTSAAASMSPTSAD